MVNFNFEKSLKTSRDRSDECGKCASPAAALCVCVRARPMNRLTDCGHDLDCCPCGGTDCWVKVQACFYAQLLVTSSVAPHRKPGWPCGVN